MKQQREILRKEKETAEKIAARAFAQSYLADLVPSVFGTLSDNGYFYDPVERGVYIVITFLHQNYVFFKLCKGNMQYRMFFVDIGGSGVEGWGGGVR